MSRIDDLERAIAAVMPELPALIGPGWPDFQNKLHDLRKGLRGDDEAAERVARQIIKLFRHYPDAHDRLMAVLERERPGARPMAGTTRSLHRPRTKLSRFPDDAHLPQAAPPPDDARATPARSIYLNAWFPDHDESDVVLRVGRKERFHVDLGPSRGSPLTESLSAQTMETLCREKSVTVMVVCPRADVFPIAITLALPPPTNIAEFTITPTLAGALDIEVMLLIRNEPVHRSTLEVRAGSDQEEV